MEITFMTIHNLSAEANILFASESIFDILGYQPHEVIGRSCFDYFHPDELPFARSVHNRGVTLDKAAVLHYARIKGINGLWVDCECVFTIVHDVLVACTSIYKHSLKSHQRAVDAPKIRRLFSTSPRDPRYHMLEHLSAKFQSSPEPAIREPRAALILNRFTRTSTILFATNAVAAIMGVSPDQLSGKSFYECIQQNCLEGAIRCLESAKANDSIAYLRFWYRNPIFHDTLDAVDGDGSFSSDSEDGGVVLNSPMKSTAQSIANHQSSDNLRSESLTPSDGSGECSSTADVQMFDSDTTGGSESRSVKNQDRYRTPGPAAGEPVEIEAVISCTSDGLVVVLRNARPSFPEHSEAAPSASYTNGFFAAPWGVDSNGPQQDLSGMANGFHADHTSGKDVKQLQSSSVSPQVTSNFMNSIREVAAFAWSLTGINGTMAAYGRGLARGEAIPETGLPIWEPYAQNNFAVNHEEQSFQNWDEYPDTNEQANGSRVPYQHTHQEQLLREQMSYGDGPMGTDIPDSSASLYIGQHVTHDNGLDPSYFSCPRSQQQIQLYEQRNQQMGEIIASHAGQSNQENYATTSSAFDRYLWY